MCLLVNVVTTRCVQGFHSLTLQGESVVECAEFLFTTLLTFSLFGNQSFLNSVKYAVKFALWFDEKQLFINVLT